MDNLLDEFMKHKPTRSLNTNKQYCHRIQKIVKEHDNNVEILDDFEELKQYLKIYKSTTRSNILTALIDYHQMKNSDPDLIELLQSEFSATSEIYKNKMKSGIFLESQKDNAISFNHLSGYMDLLDNIIYENKYVLNFNTFPAIDYLNLRLLIRLLVVHPSRNEYSTLKLIKNKVYDKLVPESFDWHQNYVVWVGRPKKYYLHIGCYKTYSHYGLKRFEITDKKLILYLDQLRKINGIGPLFKLSSGDPMNNNTMSQILIKYSKKHLGKSISSTMIYKCLINDLSCKYQLALENEDIENIKLYKGQLEEFAKARGHTLQTQQVIYFKE